MRSGRKSGTARFCCTRSALVAALVLLAVMVLTATGLARSERAAPAEQPPPPAGSVVVDPAPQLPREWRWQRKPITFDHMFRRRR